MKRIRHVLMSNLDNREVWPLRGVRRGAGGSDLAALEAADDQVGKQLGWLVMGDLGSGPGGAPHLGLDGDNDGGMNEFALLGGELKTASSFHFYPSSLSEFSFASFKNGKTIDPVVG
jgi:hypothetical protein